MRTDGGTVAALLVGALAVLCCAAPAIIAGISATALAAWLSYSGYVLMAVALIAAAIGGLWLWHRAVDSCSGKNSSAQGSKS